LHVVVAIIRGRGLHEASISLRRGQPIGASNVEQPTLIGAEPSVQIRSTCNPSGDRGEEVTVVPYGLLYRLGLVPWERRDVAGVWERVLARADAPEPGRALDVGCGSGRDAVYLAGRGWQVTAVDYVEKALARARERAAGAGVEVQWVRGDVGELGDLGLQPGYSLAYDFGCIHGLPDSARRGVAVGLNRLAAPGATLLIFAFKAGQRMLLPRGIDQDELIALLGNGWRLDESRSVAAEVPGPARRADPRLYRLTRDGESDAV
jgi:SAM-dependent methyltransferase